MKIPLLHPLEKKIRQQLRDGGFDVKSANYAKKIKPILTPIITENNEKGFLKTQHSNTPRVSILIPVHNQFDYTRKCLNSIARNTSPEVQYEIILIDDLSSDETTNIDRYYPDINVIKNTQNQGFLRNINHAASVARGEYIHLLNNDTIVTPGWLTSMLNVFSRFDKTGAVGSKLVYPNGALQEAGGYITSDAHFGNMGKLQSYFDLRYNYIREVDYVSGASLLIRKNIWDELGGFDEKYLPAYFEDTDLAMRIRQVGFMVMYQPQSTVFHFESISYNKSPSSSKATQMETNKKIFLSRWQDEMTKTHHHRHAGFRLYERNDSQQKTILYIDGEVPHQYSCGARLSLNYTKLLKEMGYNIKFLPMGTSPTMETDILNMGQLGVEN
jgi:GT2 family glycosyltransferase